MTQQEASLALEKAMVRMKSEIAQMAKQEAEGENEKIALEAEVCARAQLPCCQCFSQCRRSI